jgi:hypothetical protein
MKLIHHHIARRVALIAGFICCACALSGCGPSSKDFGLAALVGAPLVLLLCYMWPLSYQHIMRRHMHVDAASIILHVAIIVGLGMLTSWSFDLLPNNHNDLIPIVCGLATCSMVTYIQLGWLIWCYKKPKHRVFPMVLFIFGLFYLAPASIAALDLELLEGESVELALIGIWLLPGFYGGSTFILFCVCISLAILARRAHPDNQTREEARIARIFD